jgi:hypothetical protein
MFKANEIIHYDGKVGRVLYHDPIFSNVYVLCRVNENTWKQEKWYSISCQKYSGILWDMHIPFCIKYTHWHNRMEIDDDEPYEYVMYVNFRK